MKYMYKIHRHFTIHFDLKQLQLKTIWENENFTRICTPFNEDFGCLNFLHLKFKKSIRNVTGKILISLKRSDNVPRNWPCCWLNLWSMELYIFFIWIFRGKSILCIHTKHSLLIINLHEQQAYTVVQRTDLAKSLHFCTPFNVNISIPRPLNP